MKWAAVMLLVLLAGCTQPTAPVDAVVPEPEPLPDLFGLVLDQDGDRLQGALVELPGVGASQETDLNGSFAFQLDPGDYAVHVSKAGHKGTQTVIAVIANLSAHAVFTLPTWASLPADVSVLEHRGFLECSVRSDATGPDCPTDPGGGTDSFDVELDLWDDPVRDVIIEVFWDAVTASNEHLSATVVTEEGHWLAQVAGTSPLRIQLSEAALGGRTHFSVDVTVDAGDGPAGYAVAQKYDAFTSVFLNKGANDGYSIRS